MTTRSATTLANLNGLRQSGAGILIAAAFFGSAAYGNRIIDNTANDNGLPGVTVHSHGLRQNLNGNVIRGNVIGRNGLGAPHSGPGDQDAGVRHTTGILVWSEAIKLKGIRITGNRISHDHFGIWTHHSSPVKRKANRYSHVQVPLRQHPR
jgi:nitrous oxidase accessory protein NosD